MVKVVDGDTIDVRYDQEVHRVRLLNVDAPETKHPDEPVQCLGPEAASYLEDALRVGDVVRLEFDEEMHDRYGRVLAGVFEDDVLINAEIARRGLGVPVLFEPNDKFYDEVVAAYEEGKAAQAGMFSPGLDCTLTSQVAGYAEQVAELEALAAQGEPEEVRSAAEDVVSAGVAVIALIDGAKPGSPAAAGLTAAELEGTRTEAVGLHSRAEAVLTAAVEEAERVKAEEDEKKAEEEAQRKAEEEAERKAQEEAERKAQEEAERKAEEEAQRKAAEEAERAAEEARRQEEAAAEEARRAEAEALQRAQEEADRRAAEEAAQPAPPAPEPSPSVYYENCTAARAAGAAPVYIGQPGYAPHLDRDRDGIGCE